MPSWFSELANHAHSGITHFPIALLVVSVALQLGSRRWPGLAPSAWLTLLVGTAATIISTISGLIAHLPYQDSAASGAIEVHQYLAFATTAIFAVLTVWQWRAGRRTNLNRSTLFTLVGVVGAVVVLLTGYYGGLLVLQHGVGVTGVAPRP